MSSCPIGPIWAAGALAWGRASGEEIRLLCVDETLFAMPFLTGMIGHEYAHLAIERLAGSPGRVPWWLHEGLADLLAEKTADAQGELPDGWLRQAEAVPVAMICQTALSIQDPEHNRHLRELARQLAACLWTECGGEGVRKVVRDLGAGASVDEALGNQGIDGMGGLVGLWHARLKAEEDT